MVIVHSFLGSKYLHVHTFENFFSAHMRITKLMYYLYSEILNLLKCNILRIFFPFSENYQFLDKVLF